MRSFKAAQREAMDDADNAGLLAARACVSTAALLAEDAAAEAAATPARAVGAAAGGAPSLAACEAGPSAGNAPDDATRAGAFAGVAIGSARVSGVLFRDAAAK